MILYIMRHAEAVEENENLPDEWRYLSEKGRITAKKMSEAIIKKSPKPRLIITSPLTRAVQTAETVAVHACRKNVVIASTALLPGSDIQLIMEQIRNNSSVKRIMLVGHEPFLGSLSATLLGCPEEEVVLKKGGCLALKLDPEALDKPATFLWYLAPDKKRVSTFKKAFATVPG